MSAVMPGAQMFGLGGPRMADAGVELGPDLTDAATMGWFDHWGSTRRYLTALRWARAAIRRRRPSAVIVIDSAGISFPMARYARSLRIPVVYYITPHSWLWNPAGSVARLRAHADIVVPVLKPEADLYESSGLTVVFHGHPLVDDLPDRVQTTAATSQATSAATGLAIVPGSRRHAIRRLLPVMLDAASLIAERAGIRDARIAMASEAFRGEVDAALGNHHTLSLTLDTTLAHVLDRSRIAIAASGSNLLEAVAAGVPVVACYRLDPISYAFADYVLALKDRIPAFAMPNIIAGEPIVPELIQDDVTAERIAGHALRIARDGPARDAVLEGYARVRERLGAPGATRRIAEELVTRLDLA
jgi:lipid-A-disaccharide synthase